MKFDLSQTDRAAILLAERKNIEIDKADAELLGSQIILESTSIILESYVLQVAFLTCFNAACRIFKGGVVCDIPEKIPNLLNYRGETFNDVLKSFFTPLDRVQESSLNSITKILFGRSPETENEVEVVCSGWKGGINIYKSPVINLKNDSSKIPLGACLASSYALFWAFNRTFSITDEPINYSFGYSLWDNTADYEWVYDDIEPLYIKIPPKLWLVGLGHLGQAYLWVLSNLVSDTSLEILLQDDDKLGVENLGAQLLSFNCQIGLKKTKVCSEYLEHLGIETRIIEKKFGKIDQTDPFLIDYKILLTGLDNISSRKEIDSKRFWICLDGATNGKLVNFDSFTFHNLNCSKRSPTEIWDGNGIENEIMHKNLYRMSEEKGGCGYLTNIGVSTPFVGLFGASIVVSEMLKYLLNGGNLISFSGNLRSINTYSSIQSQKD